MIAYFAVGDAASALKYLKGERCLVSFAYVGTSWVKLRELDDLHKVCFEVVYDSGAFTEWQRKLKGKAAKDITVESYAAFLSAAPHGPWSWALNLDVIDDGNASVRNFERLRALLPPPLAAKIVPVWHEGAPIEHLDAYLATTDLIALGRTEGRRVKKKALAFYDEAFNHTAGSGVKFHALGNGTAETLEPYPFYSFDSTGWQRDATYGETHGWPWSRVSKQTRMSAYIEAYKSIKHKPTQQMDLFRPY